MYSFCELNECCTFNDERIVMLLVHENEIKKLRDRVRVARARANFSSQRVFFLRVRVRVRDLRARALRAQENLARSPLWFI